MITSCVILAKERFVNLTVLQLDGIQDILLILTTAALP